MKKLLTVTTLLFILLFVLTGCKCADGEHQYVSQIKTKASCSAEGILAYKCEKCGDSYTEPIEKTPHTYTETVKEATCAEEGVKTFVCETCGDTYTEPIEKIPHDYTETVKEATCIQEGVKTFTCKVCGDTYTESIEKTAHTYVESVKAATCTEKGVKTFACKTCKDTYTEEIEALGHSWDAATCQNPKTCKRCKLTEGGTGPHSYSAGKCTVCGDYENNYSLSDAVNQGYIQANVVMSSIDRGRIEIKNRTNNYLFLTIPAGTYFVASSPSDQNMLVTTPKTVSLSPNSSTTVNLSTACMNIKRDIPNERAGYTVGYSNDQVLQNLVKLFEENNTSYYVRQAAVWIVTDNASYSDTGTLVSNGRQAISMSDYNEAERLVARARGY